MVWSRSQSLTGGGRLQELYLDTFFYSFFLWGGKLLVFWKTGHWGKVVRPYYIFHQISKSELQSKLGNLLNQLSQTKRYTYRQLCHILLSFFLFVFIVVIIFITLPLTFLISRFHLSIYNVSPLQGKELRNQFTPLTILTDSDSKLMLNV